MAERAGLVGPLLRGAAQRHRDDPARRCRHRHPRQYHIRGRRLSVRAMRCQGRECDARRRQLDANSVVGGRTTWSGHESRHMHR